MSNPAQRETNPSPPRASVTDAGSGDANSSADAPLLPIEQAIAEDLGEDRGREFIGELVDVREELHELLDPEEASS